MRAPCDVAEIELAPEGRFACGQCGALYREGFERCPRDGTALVSGVCDPLLGRTLSGRYRVEAVIGEGGMGRVYRAIHVCDEIARPVAIKTLFGDLAAAPRNRLRFANEARAASRLQHPNVVPVIDYGGERDEPMYLAMELVEGETIDDRLKRGPLPVAEAIEIAIQLARGLAHAHERGVVHRDLKPSNVGLTRPNGLLVARIFDFGLALVEEPSGEPARLTTTGMVHGTPLYLSPEQARGETADARSDLYALGVILHEMITGHPPFDTGAVCDILNQHLSSRPPSLSERCGRPMSARLEAVVSRLLEKRRERRYGCAEDVAEALSRMAADLDRLEALAATIDGSVASPAIAAPSIEAGSQTKAIGSERRDARRCIPSRWLSAIAAAAVGIALGLAGGTEMTALPLEVEAVEAAPEAPASETGAAPSAREIAATPDRGAQQAAIGRNAGAEPRRTGSQRATSIESLSSQYARTGAVIERLHQIDAEGSDALRRQYLESGYARAVREPAHRAEVMRRLRELEKRGSRLQRLARAPRR